MIGRFGGSREPMSNVDTAWLRMERPTNLMMITGVMVFEGHLDVQKLKHVLRNRFLSFKRFRQRAVDRAGTAYWELDPNFEMDAHVRRTALPGRADKAELQALVSLLASTPLDFTKPLWRFDVVENYERGSALIARIHHCYADGIALIQVLLSMTAEDAEESEKLVPVRERKVRDSGVFERLAGPATRGLAGAMRLGRMALNEGNEVLRDPGRLAVYGRSGLEIAEELTSALLLPNDSETRFKGPLGVKKAVAWAEPIPLQEVKTVAKALGCTVNDVLVSAVTGALRGYLIAQGDEVDGLEIRATVPVNLRPLEHAKDLGNHFGLVFLALPIGIGNPLARLYRINRDMQALKSSKQAVVTFGALAALGLGPSALQRPALDALSRKATAVLTNVPGPQKDLYLAGAKTIEHMFWVPQSGTIGMGVSILSYAGRVQFGLIVDAKLVHDPDLIIGRFAGEFEKLLLATLMGDWGARPGPEIADAALADA